jgi:hypothetical protein
MQQKAKDLAKKAKDNISDDADFQKSIKIAMDRFNKSI